MPSDNDIVYTDHGKKNNKFRRETSDKNTILELSKEKLKRKVQVHVIHRLAKRRPKNPWKNPPNRKIRFMYKRIKKANRQRAEQKDEVVYLGSQPEHPK